MLESELDSLVDFLTVKKETRRVHSLISVRARFRTFTCNMAIKIVTEKIAKLFTTDLHKSCSLIGCKSERRL